MPSSVLGRSRSCCSLDIPIQRLKTYKLSTVPAPYSSLTLINASNRNHNPNNTDDSDFGSFLKWVTGIVAGSSLGTLYCYSTRSGSELVDLKNCLSHADCATTDTETALHDGGHSSSVFSKFSLPKTSDFWLVGEAYRRKVFFKYEKRIRLRSQPEKVFEYFASSRSPKGEVLMKPADLMRAVVPVFPPSESHLVRDGYLSWERTPGALRCAPSEFFMLFDLDNDGHISFKEYIFFVTLLSIPESSFSIAFKMFDVDSSGQINKEEFQKVMALMRASNRQGSHHRSGLRTGLHASGSVENGGLVEYFFGKDGKGHLHHDRFVQFLRDLHDEIIRLEFAHYDFESRGTISAKDFALSMVASADMSHLDKLIDQVDKINSEPHFRNMRITYEEFKVFAELRKKLQPFTMALFSFGKVNGLLTRSDFQRAASQVCGISLSDDVVDVIFHVFDSNEDEYLSSIEFVRVLHKRERDIAQPVDSGILGLLSCCWGCTENYRISKLLS